MTTEQLTKHFNYIFGSGSISNKWPETYKVSARTYGNVCQSILDYKINKLKEQNTAYPNLNIIEILVGENNGLMFKNVELILDDSIESDDD